MNFLLHVHKITQIHTKKLTIIIIYTIFIQTFINDTLCDKHDGSLFNLTSYRLNNGDSE